MKILFFQASRFLLNNGGKTFFLAVILLIPGCTTYEPGSTNEERIVARYEQNIILEDDDPQKFKKICKHTLADISTLLFAEIWYAKVRKSYNELKLLEKKEEDFRNFYIGKTREEIIRDFGAPEKVYQDSTIGEILVYSQFARQIRIGFWRMSAEERSTGRSTEFFIDKDTRKISDVRFHSSRR